TTTAVRQILAITIIMEAKKMNCVGHARRTMMEGVELRLGIHLLQRRSGVCPGQRGSTRTRRIVGVHLDDISILVQVGHVTPLPYYNTSPSSSVSPSWSTFGSFSASAGGCSIPPSYLLCYSSAP